MIIVSCPSIAEIKFKAISVHIIKVLTANYMTEQVLISLTQFMHTAPV